MGLTDCYVLEGREIQGEPEPGEECPAAPCIFCGTVIKHFNDGGTGWMVGAVGPDGHSHDYLCCDQPMCEARIKADRQARIVMRTPEKERVLFRCGCVSDYVESVGDRCHECGAERDCLVPWEG